MIERVWQRGTKAILWNNANRHRTQMPQCHSNTIVKNGKKSNGSRNYLCKDCGRQFIADHEKTYRGCLTGIAELVKIMLVRGVGIRDASAILKISVPLPQLRLRLTAIILCGSPPSFFKKKSI
ncbi:MAG: hypothetical protein LBG87_09980 [Spirochaetaceae bacterium]|nr:hypothetical protein [Spirochaetaceae bacterium]